MYKRQNYYRHMDYRREHEAMFSELSEKELNQLFVMDEYGVCLLYTSIFDTSFLDFGYKKLL